MNYYYLDAASQPAGPLPLEEIRRKAATGEIPAQPMIAAVGTSQWQPLSGSATPVASLAVGGFRFESVMSDAIVVVLKLAAQVFSAEYLHSCLAAARLAGHIAVVAGAVLGLILVGYRTYVQGSVSVLLDGLSLIAIIAVAHYATQRLQTANAGLLARSRLASAALPDCAGALALVAILAALIGAITAVMQLGLEAWPVLISLGVAVWAWTCFAAIAFHPETVQIEFTPGSAAEEGLDVAQFLLKSALVLVPLAFGITAVLADVSLVLTLFNLGDEAHALTRHTLIPLPRPLRSIGSGFDGLSLLLSACLLPLYAHLAYIVASWPLGLWRSMIIMPSKLDALKR